MTQLITVLVYLVLIVVSIYGWVVNIFNIAAATEITGLVVVQVIGVFMFPVGALLGLFV